jgi:hypothetical protein
LVENQTFSYIVCCLKQTDFFLFFLYPTPLSKMNENNQKFHSLLYI